MGQSHGPGDYEAPEMRQWGGPPSSEHVRPMDPLVGTTVLGSYYIMQRLGSGGIGTVYKGRHLETDRIVAIKTLKGYLLTDPVVVKRFEREAKGLSKLQHQNIVAALDCLMSPQGQPFFIMEYLEGITLARYIKEEGALDPEDARPICLQLCEALSHVHRHGLLHRDLKPENVILMPQNDGSVLAKVVDFGLAQIKDNIQRVTVDGTVVGSPVYMSPEQCMGREPDHRSDLYSLGIIMYETLVGRPPFVGNPMDIMKAHVSEQPPTFAAVRPFLEVSKEIEKVVFKALEKHPDDRYQSAKEFRHAIEFWIAPQTTSRSGPLSSSQGSAKAGLNRTQELGKQALRARDSGRVDKRKLIISIVAGVCAIVFSNVALVFLVQYMKASEPGPSPLAVLRSLPRIGPDDLAVTAAGERVSIQADDVTEGSPKVGAQTGAATGASSGEAPLTEAQLQGEEGSAAGGGQQVAITTTTAKGITKSAKPVAAQSGGEQSVSADSSTDSTGDATTGDGTPAGDEPKKPKTLNTKEAYVASDCIGVTAAGIRFELPLSVFPPEEPPAAPKPKKAAPAKAVPLSGSKSTKAATTQATPAQPRVSTVAPAAQGANAKPAKAKQSKADSGGGSPALSNSKLFGQKLPGNVYGDWKYLDRQRTNKTVENSQ